MPASRRLAAPAHADVVRRRDEIYLSSDGSDLCYGYGYGYGYGCAAWRSGCGGAAAAEWEGGGGGGGG